ncbi:iron(III) transport system permease protein [Neorhizobium galegae]|uniref:ABC transporter permease n=1 Tax=Neorhizobium galegae TaxID=399 RepID=UPI002787C8DE|nr:ABC transporter permease subunit [Neorhizobium galegae]MDQ0137701.1 iron(III) transport system permease protein [Neorhizobium galegae]
MLLVGAFRTSPYGARSAWTLRGISNVFSDPNTFWAAVGSLVYAALVTLLGIVGGLYFATLVTRLKVFGVAIIVPMMIVLAATPRLFYALAWGMVGNPNSGLIGNALRPIGLGNIASVLTVYSWLGMIFVSGLKVTALSFFLLYGAVSRADRSIEDAAVMSGSSRLGAFFRITIPVLTPAILVVAMLLFIEGIQVFDYPAVLGAPAGVNTLSLRVSDYLLKSLEPDWSAAGALSLVSVILVGILLLIQRMMTRGRQFTTVGGKAAQETTTDVGAWAPLITLSIGIFLVVALVLPIVQIIWGSFQSFFGVYGSLTLMHYEKLLGDPATVRTVVTTFAISIGGGAITVAVAFAMAYVMQRRSSGFLAWLVRFGSWIPATAPGIVLSLALVWSYLYTPILNKLYGTAWLMLAALIVASIPIAVRATEGMVAQISPELEEAARISGASPFVTALHITARLCTPGLLAAWLLVALAISGMLDVPLLLQTTGSQTVATQAYSLFSSGAIAEAAALYNCFIILVVAFCGSAALIGLTVRAFAARAVPTTENQLRTAA